MLDRRWNIAGEHFGGVVEQRHRSCAVGVQRPPEQAVANLAKHMREKRNMIGMLRNIFTGRIAHEAPASRYICSRYMR